MTTELREALDDLAGDEMRGLRLDVAAARAVSARTSSARLRRLPRFTARTTLWAAVAAAILVAVPALLVFTVFRPVTVPSEPQPGPDRWVWRAAPDVPPLRAGMMDSASMVLGMPVQLRATLNPDGTTNVMAFPPHALERAPVLASADGRTYAALPWPSGSELLTLSKDGRRVAWVSMAERGKKATTTVYWLQVADGVLHTAVLPAEASDEWPTQVAFADSRGDGVLVGTRYRNNGQIPTQEHLWKWTPSSSGAPVAAVCTCRPTAFGISPDGTLWQGTARGHAPVPGVQRSPVRSGTPTTSTAGWGGDVTSESLLVDDDGGVATISSGERFYAVTEGASKSVVELSGLGPRVQGVWAVGRDAAGLYAWVLHGRQPALTTEDAQLVLIDPATGVAKQVAHGDGRVVPLAVSGA